MPLFIKSSVEVYKAKEEKNALVNLHQISTMCTETALKDGEETVHRIVFRISGGSHSEVWQYKDKQVRDADYSAILAQLDVLDLAPIDGKYKK